MHNQTIAEPAAAAVIYVDFDDTVYCHQYHWGFDEDIKYNLLYGLDRIHLEARYLNVDLINKLYQIRAYNESRGIQTYIYLLTGCRTSVFLNAKRKVIEEKYNDLFDDYLSVCEPKEKLIVTQYYNNYIENTHSVKIVNTIMIDDNIYIVNMFQDNDMEAMTPMYFEKYYEYAE